MIRIFPRSSVKINLTDDPRPTNMYYNYTMEAI